MLNELQKSWLEDFLGIGSGGGPQAASAGASASSSEPSAGGADAMKVDQARLKSVSAMWATTEAKVRDDVNVLHGELKELYADDPAEAQMEAVFGQHVQAIFAAFDGTLAQDLAKAAAASGPDDFAKAKSELKTLIEQQIKFVTSDPVIPKIQSNPFVDIDITGECMKTLDEMLRLVA